METEAELETAIAAARQEAIRSGFLTYQRPDPTMDLAVRAVNLPRSVFVLVTEAIDLDPTPVDKAEPVKIEESLWR